MKTKLFFILLFMCYAKFSFAYDVIEKDNPKPENEVLILIVDYTTNAFEGGQILRFPEKPAETLTITYDYRAPGDFGFIKLYYSEINELLFYGDIIWMGRGNILFPETWIAPEDFVHTDTKDLVFPKNGFWNVIPYSSAGITDDVWYSVQSIIKVRDFLLSNPEQKVQYLFYTPSVGVGDPKDWKWILFLHSPSMTRDLPKLTSSEFNVYPAITEDKLYVKTKSNVWSYQIYSNQGQLIQSGIGGNYIDVSCLNQGIYILNICNDNNDGKLYSHKFIKK